MAWDDSSEVLIAGTGEVYVAPVGTAAPTTSAAALNAGFEGLGFHSPDGVSVANAPEILEVRAWQTKQVIRAERQADDFRLTFSLLQWNDVTVPIAFGGGTIVSDGSTGYKYTPPTASDALATRALICDVRDGTRWGRFVIPRGAVVEAVEAQFSATAEAQLPITFQAQPSDNSAGWIFLSSDAAAFAPGS